jgi:hypothetical protein
MFVSLILVGIIAHHCLNFLFIIRVNTVFNIALVSEYYSIITAELVKKSSNINKSNKHFSPQII